ncbi:MAG: TetR/AcrR family transcriptional regulator [Candidatus Limnocylindrales bacterium]
MAVVRTPRTAWIDAGLRALSAGGPDAVRVEPLARVLGVTKGGFYWHFDDRGGLLDAMLDTWERMVIDDVIDRVEGDGGDARAKLRRLFALAAARRDFVEVELAVRDWARRDKAAAQRLRRVDNRRMGYLRSQFREICDDAGEVEVRCMLVMSLFIATHFIAADHDGRRRSDVIQLTLARLLD